MDGPPMQQPRVSWRPSTFTKVRYAVGGVCLLIAGGVYLYQHQGIEADGHSVEQQIVDQYQPMVTNGTLYATCPAKVHLRKGKIVDCSVERSTGGTSPVFITGVDNSGHFRMHLGNATALFTP